MWSVNQRWSFDFLSTRRKWKRKGGNISFQVITHRNLAHSLLPSQTNPWWFEPPGKAAVFCFCCIFMSYLLRSLNLFQGMARPAFIANVSAPISIVDKIPALSKALLSSSLRVSTSLWIRAVALLHWEHCVSSAFLSALSSKSLNWLLWFVGGIWSPVWMSLAKVRLNII